MQSTKRNWRRGARGPNKWRSYTDQRCKNRNIVARFGGSVVFAEGQCVISFPGFARPHLALNKMRQPLMRENLRRNYCAPPSFSDRR
jgi:hypothetical protein